MEIRPQKKTAAYIPFVSLIGEKWKIAANVDGNLKLNDADYFTSQKLSGAWQNSWIQYDAEGNPVTSRDGKTVYYNTQWPPVMPMYFRSQFTVDGKSYDLGLDSNALSFVAYSNETKTGAQWNQELGLNVEFGDLSGEKFDLYTVSNVWVNGNFKLWSGWNGERNETNGDAEWSRNWNWGKVEGQEVGIGKTTALTNEKGDMTFSTPTFAGTIYFFSYHDSPNAEGKSRIYMANAEVQPSIMALSHLDDYAFGLFKPAISGLGGKSVAGIKLNVAPASEVPSNASQVNDGIGRTFWTATNLNISNDDDFESAFSNFQHPAIDDPANDSAFFEDGQSYETAGQYKYILTVTYSDGTSQSVPSNAFYIKGEVGDVIARQLIQKPDGSYVTYAEGKKTYAVTVDEDNSTATFAPATVEPSAEELSTWTWTEKVVVSIDLKDVAASGNIQWYDRNGNELNNFDETGATFLYVTTASAKSFDVQPYFTVDGDKSKGESFNEPVTMYFPTPVVKMAGVELQQTGRGATVNVAATAHNGVINYYKSQEFISDNEYQEAVLHALNVNVDVEAPNATDKLYDIFKDTKIAFTGSADDYIAAQLAGLVYTVPATKAANETISLTYQDISKWQTGVEDGMAVLSPLAANISFAAAEGVNLYNRMTAPVSFDLGAAISKPTFEEKDIVVEVRRDINPESENYGVESVVFGGIDNAKADTKHGTLSVGNVSTSVTDGFHMGVKLVHEGNTFSGESYVAPANTFINIDSGYTLDTKDELLAKSFLTEWDSADKQVELASCKVDEAYNGEWWWNYDKWTIPTELTFEISDVVFFNTASSVYTENAANISAESATFAAPRAAEESYIAFAPAKVEVVRTVGASDLPTEVEGINAEQNGDAVYYNLQGVRVAEPTEAGVYIKVCNGKSEKFLVK